MATLLIYYFLFVSLAIGFTIMVWKFFDMFLCMVSDLFKSMLK